MEEIRGTVKTIIFRSDDTGFTVLELVDSSGDEITAVGSMPLANVGERVEIRGNWTTHRAYGMQFAVEEYRMLAPETLSALVSYLSSGLITGIGDSTARSIVATFGEHTLDVLENDPMRLCEVPGIGSTRAHTIYRSYSAQRNMRDAMITMAGYGMTVTQSMKVYKQYGQMCISRIQENPYQLVDDIEGIGFKIADRIAKNAGIAENSPFRTRAGVKYTLQWARQEGHTYLPYDVLVFAACKVLSCESLPVERATDELILDMQLIKKEINGETAVFLPFMYTVESECAKKLIALARHAPHMTTFGLDAKIASLEQKIGVKLAALQSQAVKNALRQGVTVITGGPGTGKTTILDFIIRVFESLGVSCELCAPTGRAAKRMSEATGCEARTIHRLLEYGYGIDGFTRDEDNPIDAEVIIVDEMSMVDAPLMYSLLRAVSVGTRLVLVGDADQLPPVGAGNVLRDMIESGSVPVIRLTEIFRQGERSAIVESAHEINDGKNPLLLPEGEFRFESISEAELIARRLVAICSGKVKSVMTQDALCEVQVLSPMKKGPLGVLALNERLQSELNPPMHKKREKRFGDTVFREGDKVMQIKNDYRIEWTRVIKGRIEQGEGVFNGDLGTIMKVDLDEHCVHVLFDDGRNAVYAFAMLDSLELAYCISIHKSQGSEFPVVVLPLAGGPTILMTRNLLYTGVTRARKQVIIVGREETVYSMVRNNQVRARHSALGTMMKELFALGEELQ